MKTLLRRAVLPLYAALACLLPACASQPPMPTVAHVDLPRFMGDWYVIACIPTLIERDAFNAVESYHLDPDGSIATTFTLRAGGFGGKEKRYTPHGYVEDAASNALWGMQFIWPIRAEYRIVHLAPDYSQAIIARSRRDYVWIMARTPAISDADYGLLQDKVQALGYDVNQLRKVPQRWN